MSQPHINEDREREAALARAELVRRPEAEGVKPFAALEDFAGDPELVADFDVDEFLREVREDRDRPSRGGARSGASPARKEGKR